MIQYHPRVLADKLEGIVPELQRWSHRARIALDNAQIQQKRREDRLLQTNHSAQTQEHQLAQDQERTRQDEELLQVRAKNCQEALTKAQQTASVAQSTLHEAQTTHNRMQQALQRAREVLAQAEQALQQASASLEGQKAASTKASTAEGDKQAADSKLSQAKEAQRQASHKVHAASARVANYEKAVISANQALQLAEVTHQHAQTGLKASEDSMEFVRAASKALDVGKQELGKEEVVVRATLEALEHATLLTQESSSHASAACSHEQPAQLHISDTLRVLQEKIGLLISMNRPELELSSDPIAALLQLHAAAGRGELTELLNPTLEMLLTKLDEIDDLKPHQWSTFRVEKRAKILQSAHNAVAAVYGFHPSPVEVMQLPARLHGRFLPTTEVIQISRTLAAGNDFIETLKTLIHESRHAYQWDFLRPIRQGYGWLSNANWELAQKWNDNFEDYKDGQQYGTQEYRNQPIEVDARNFEETVIKLLFWK
jgi:hypothetical protein